ncbi:MAG: hypothetical protein H7Y27_13990 [Gemmatimonadaceae bacterium]|nr:hypothetical protein [Chitinophagaceae bacterium]
MKQFITIFCFSVLLVFSSCRKESFITSPDARLSISADTLHFDTVFTSLGSVTQFFKIRNDNNQQLKLDRISLRGGSASAFKINIDGSPGPEATNLEIDANDSLYVFVSVSVNPNLNNLPFVVADSIEVQFNGNKRLVQLEAWGQNANFLRDRVITGNTVWNNTLPYVILGSVRVDTTATLTIQKGARIYLHADAPFLVDGSLIVQGEKDTSARVYFRGDRRDVPYDQYPGSWPGIYFRQTSKDNVLKYAVIQNGYQGVVAELPSINANPKLRMEQCIIDNIYDAGIFAVQSSIIADNCLVSNSGKNVVLVLGGNYQFNHCTIATFSNSYITHKEPVFFLTNNVKQGTGTLVADLNASFRNCIFWGDNGVTDNEVVVSREGTGNIFNVVFENSLWKVKTAPPGVIANKMLSNTDPLFDSIDVQKRIFVFRLKDGSPAINQGLVTGLAVDLDGMSRPVGLPDIGAYERR